MSGGINFDGARKKGEPMPRTVIALILLLVATGSSPLRGQQPAAGSSPLQGQGQNQLPSIGFGEEQTDAEALIHVLGPVGAGGIILDCIFRDPCVLEQARDGLRAIWCPLRTATFKTANGFWREQVSEVRAWETSEANPQKTVLQLRSGEQVEVAEKLSAVTAKLNCQDR